VKLKEVCPHFCSLANEFFTHYWYSLYQSNQSQKYLTQFWSGQTHLGLENFPQNPNILNFFPSDQKNLIRSGQKIPGSKAG